MEVSYGTSFEEVIWGITLVAVTMAIHGYGMLLTLFACHVIKDGTTQPMSFTRGGLMLILASWMIVFVHLIELMVWALFFLWQGAMPNASTSYYFALMQYTTVGSTLSLPLRWHLLDGMLPIAGLMTFAWSTGVLLTLAQEFQTEQLTMIHQRRAARRTARAARRARKDGSAR